MCYVFVCTMMTFGDLSVYPSCFIKYPLVVSAGARTHPDPRMRQLCKFVVSSAAMFQPCLSLDDWDWDHVFLDDDGTNFVQQAYDMYTFESCHSFLLSESACWGACSGQACFDVPSSVPCADDLPFCCAGLDALLCNCVTYTVMANHYGQLSAAVQAYEMAMGCADNILAQPNQVWLSLAAALLLPQ